MRERAGRGRHQRASESGWVEMLPLLAWLFPTSYIPPAGEHVPATVIGPFTRGDGFIHLEYTRNGHEIEHHAPGPCPLPNPHPLPITWCPGVGVLVAVRYGEVFTTYLLLVPCIACKHSLVRARGPRLTVGFPAFQRACAGGWGSGGRVLLISRGGGGGVRPPPPLK